MADVSGAGRAVAAEGQIAFAFAHQPRFDEMGFVAARSNAAARAWLFSGDAVHSWSDGRLVLWGGAGRGKTHLLRAWAARRGALVVGCEAGLPDAAGLMEREPVALALDSVPTREIDELALLRTVNMARERHVPLLMAARLPPGRWTVSLPDLQSRLRATMAVELRPAEDALLLRLMLRLLAERQLVVSRSVTEWLLHRLPREARAVQEVVARIDAATLVSGAPLDRSGAARVLAEMSGCGE
ncbi:chromosomal replication initiator DnaA [Acetobacter sp. LMG 1636]|uniref:Chromosomal replication initiator DnaA n=1 Tax=Acetobacter fallax TaxID=1737473 RepID=A0ABX0KB55_9PROT|nr:chromosomal replication initiator DnaA [Acetobacter fallax]NHO36649.1 chromosomal replication initiator DnaA [Acetobacter fallax]